MCGAFFSKIFDENPKTSITAGEGDAGAAESELTMRAEHFAISLIFSLIYSRQKELIST